MNAVRIRRRVESETLHLPELRPLIGKDVEIIVLEEQSIQEFASSRPDVGKLRELAVQIDYDFSAFERLREISKL